MFGDAFEAAHDEPARDSNGRERDEHAADDGEEEQDPLHRPLPAELRAQTALDGPDIRIEIHFGFAKCAERVVRRRTARGHRGIEEAVFVLRESREFGQVCGEHVLRVRRGCDAGEASGDAIARIAVGGERFGVAAADVNARCGIGVEQRDEQRIGGCDVARDFPSLSFDVLGSGTDDGDDQHQHQHQAER